MKKFETIIIGVIISVVSIVILAINNVFPNDYYIYDNETISYMKATVLSIESDNTIQSIDFGDWSLGTQELLVKFTSGELKGEEVLVRNNLSETQNVTVKEGSKIVVKADMPNNVTPYFSVYNYDRDISLIVVVILFICAMIFVAKIKGLKSVIGLMYSLFVIICFLLHAIYRGWSPIIVTIITVILISMISLLLLNGFCEKTYTSIIATITGVVISTILFMIMQSVLKLSGYHLDEAESLIMISRSTGLKIDEVFFSAVLISSLGAVIDTAMSIASAIYEIREVNPSIKRVELYKSGVSIGQDMIGTMCQTLILAFVGSSIATLLVLIAYGTQFNQFMSSNYIALEVVQAVAGSTAIIFTVPITAWLSTLTHKDKKKA